MKWFLVLIPAVIVGLIIFLSIYLSPNDLRDCQDTPTDSPAQCVAADAIVVVSGGDTALRTQTGIDLYNAGWASSLVLSGAAYDTTGPSNAETMKAQALAAGVPEQAIYTDEEARTTEENAANTLSLFSRYGFKRVILVTSAYHQRRASLEFERHNTAENITIVNRPVSDDGDWAAWWWVTPRGWWLALGEGVKITALYAQEGAR